MGGARPSTLKSSYPQIKTQYPLGGGGWILGFQESFPHRNSLFLLTLALNKVWCCKSSFLPFNSLIGPENKPIPGNLRQDKTK